MLAVVLAAGCKAQNAQPPASDPSTNWRIEVLIRNQMNLRPDIEVTIGNRTPSPFAGYDSLPITLSRGTTKVPLEHYLISTDNKTLTKLASVDLQSSPNFNIDIAGRPVRGNPAAKVTLVNFDDLECPYCARLHQELFPGTLDRYKDKIRIVYKDNPLLEIHPWAMRASVDANCLAAQNGEAYWAFVDYVHSHAQEVSGDDRDASKSAAALDRIARQQGQIAKVDSGKLDQCIARQDTSQIHASMTEAEDLGAEGAPVLFVDGMRIAGYVDSSYLWAVIDRALKNAGVTPPAPAQPLVSGGR